MYSNLRFEVNNAPSYRKVEACPLFKMTVHAKRSKNGMRLYLLIFFGVRLLEKLKWKTNDSLSIKYSDDNTIVELRRSKDRGYSINEKGYISFPIRKGALISDVKPVSLLDFSDMSTSRDTLIIDYYDFLD